MIIIYLTIINNLICIYYISNIFNAKTYGWTNSFTLLVNLTIYSIIFLFVLELVGKGNTDEITLSINNSDQVMLWGRSKDYGTCKGIKKNGDKCDMFVNVRNCDVCTYHIKREYIKQCSSRANIGNSRPTAAHSLRDKVRKYT